MRDLAKRTAALEARPRPVRDRTPTELRGSVNTVSTVKASLVAFYLGEWQPGADSMASLKLGLAKTTPQYCKPSLCSATQAAEHRFSGALGNWHSAERLNAAYLAIGKDRYELLRGFGDLLSRVDEFGDPVLANLEREYSKETTSSGAAAANFTPGAGRATCSA